jgi:hypothetical protein
MHGRFAAQGPARAVESPQQTLSSWQRAGAVPGLEATPRTFLGMRKLSGYDRGSARPVSGRVKIGPNRTR